MLGVNEFRKSDNTRPNNVSKGDSTTQQGNGDSVRTPLTPNNRIHRDKSTLTCFKCNKKGHIAPECTSFSPSPNIKRLEIVDAIVPSLNNVTELNSNNENFSQGLRTPCNIENIHVLGLVDG